MSPTPTLLIQCWWKSRLRDTNPTCAIRGKTAQIVTNALQNQPLGTSLVKALSSLALMYRQQRLASAQYCSAQKNHEQELVDMKGQVVRTDQLMTTAENENILPAEELHLKTEQLQVIANTYDDEQAQTLQQNRFLQKQLDFTKTKYNVVHAKQYKSFKLSRNMQFWLMLLKAVLF